MLPSSRERGSVICDMLIPRNIDTCTLRFSLETLFIFALVIAGEQSHQWREENEWCRPIIILTNVITPRPRSQ